MLASLFTLRRECGGLGTIPIPERRNLPLFIDSNYP